MNSVWQKSAKCWPRVQDQLMCAIFIHAHNRSWCFSRGSCVYHSFSLLDWFLQWSGVSWSPCKAGGTKRDYSISASSQLTQRISSWSTLAMDAAVETAIISSVASYASWVHHTTCLWHVSILCGIICRDIDIERVKMTQVIVFEALLCSQGNTKTHSAMATCKDIILLTG